MSLPQTVLLILTALLTLIASITMFGRKKFDPANKHVYITGGSMGLGRALAEMMVKAGADVTIVARGQERLDETERVLKSLAKPTQKIHTISADLTSAESSTSALQQAAANHNGQCPDILFLCAGFSHPRFFLDATTEQLQAGLDGTYWVQAWTAHAATKLMVSQRIKGQIVFVGSFLGYTSFAGYCSYSPGKYALRGLADSLRSEMLLHDISIHIFMPAGIAGPSFDAEILTKPMVTRKIEEGDKAISAAECAGHLIRGLEKGYYQPTSYFITDIMRLQSRGAVPGNNVFLDGVWWFFGSIGTPIWRMFADHLVRGFKGEVRADLEKRGFYKKAAK